MPQARLFALISVITIAGMFASKTTRANIGETYGLGSRSAAMAGASGAWSEDAYTVYTNPALMPAVATKRLSLSFSLLMMEPRFTPISNVIVSNSYVADASTPEYGEVARDYRSTFGQALGLAYRLSPEGHSVLGLVAYLPLQHVSYMDTGETFVPEYVLYRGRTQRPQIDIAWGRELSPNWRIGIGAHLGFSLSSNATAFLTTQANHPSSMRFSGSLQPKVGPYFAAHWAPTGDPQEVGVGLVVRAPVNSANNMTLKTAARIGALPAIDINFGAVSALYYDPASVDGSVTWKWGPHWRSVLQSEYQFWSRFIAPALAIQSCTSGPDCGFIVSDGGIPTVPYRNILVARMGQELELGPTSTLRFGYGYRPSIRGDVPNGAGNYLDPPKHMITAGVGFQFKTFLGIESEHRLDVHAAYHRLVSQTIAKTPGDEAGSGSGDIKIGAPGYTAGGSVYGGGATLSWLF